MANEEYQEQLKQWRQSYSIRLQNFKMFHGGLWREIEKIFILPVIGATSYGFYALPDHNVRMLDFIIILIVSSAPLIGQFIAYLLFTNDTARVIEHMEKQLQTNIPLEEPLVMKSYNVKIAKMQTWMYFILISSVLSFVMAILVRFSEIHCLIYFSRIMLGFYIVALFCFLYHLKRN